MNVIPPLQIPETAAFAFTGAWGDQMRFETTIQRPVAAKGVGLHHGVPVSIRILPAPPATGIVFLRTDLDNFAVPASWRYIARVSYATSLMRQSVLISTTEHLLSVLYSMGIDNALVKHKRELIDAEYCLNEG